MRVTFVPILPDGKPPSDHYFAEFNPANGTFQSSGKDKKGMPPGKYRVAISQFEQEISKTYVQRQAYDIDK